jgi:hypothetical protein
MILHDQKNIESNSALLLYNVRQRLRHLEADLTVSVKELEETPRHRISLESTMLEKDTKRLVQTKKMISEVDQFLESIGAPL